MLSKQELDSIQNRLANVIINDICIGEEPFDGDETEVIVQVFKTILNQCSGNITSEQYNDEMENAYKGIDNNIYRKEITARQMSIIVLGKLICDDPTEAYEKLQKADPQAQVGDIVQLTEAMEDWQYAEVDHFFKEFL